MRQIVCIVLVLWIAACTPLVPATTPPQLEYTPGAFVTLDDEVFNGGSFRVNYPDGWRVIKISIAAAPLEVIFASPDDTMLIHLSETPLPETETPPDTATRHDSIMVDTTVIYMSGQTPRNQAAAFDRLYERVRDSVRPAAPD